MSHRMLTPSNLCGYRFDATAGTALLPAATLTPVHESPTKR